MERRDLIALGLIFAAFIALVAVDWRRVFSIAGTMEAAPIVPASEPNQGTGPASAWANVPTGRFVYPPNLGGFAVPTASNDDQPAMFNCGICR